MEEKRRDVVLDVDERPGTGQWIGLSLQHMFSMFGSTVLVPILVGLNPGIALFSSGVGTLMYLLITRHKIPAYMGSSFSFIVPMMALMKSTGYPGIAQGTIAVGCVYLIVSLIVSRFGSAWIDRILPPIVVGPIVMVIGLSLAATAAKDATMNGSTYDIKYFIVAMLTLLITIIFNMFFKGFLGLIPILLGIVGGYIIACLFGIVKFSGVMSAHWFSLPAFQIPFVNYHPQFYWGAILSMAPIAFVTMTEHMGHIMVLNELTDRNYFKDPGLNHTLAGDGTASIIAGFVGGPPVTSYGENIGVLAITRVHSVYVLAGAASFAILFSFVGKLSALIESIPSPVIGGISFLLFGVIASSGLRVMIEDQTDFNEKRNLMISSVILVIGIGNAYLQLGQYEFSGLAVAAVLGIALNLVLPQKAASER
ncbi:solute carrier family 23 protein [Limosilactobacillus fermentum]|uniref:solute carrier family 23 protein n=1 Tax=Limosilactobacillus fermentum TaxID=1613 RepID=UPI000E5507D4|nr:solute carrier family 23 protein [Limosilactobacillus fermentum]MCH5382894.1 NCS2 family nucleobase:cation symporter [Limosilactobacillus fermentum]QWQ34046.1 NCS2 family nucleobase:cation symporter [Limosilactobacillus fermentum]RGU88337.1 uracil permease [Limosilactobacillus fermentum]UOG13365.1 NCS2 family nucleobase:cation symporter [Limosilactobacillus fermentum]URL82976.1 NCS2 family nucleobase:cation symporter [Limosilactobacillus fermentum]